MPLPEGHPFPMGKFPAMHRILRSEGLIAEEDVHEPRPARWSDLLSVHEPDYLEALDRGRLDAEAERKMGLPWSRRLVRRSRLAVQGTLDAAFMALEDGIAANLAGGTHHAMPIRGEGFCVLNDVAVAIRALRRSRWIRRALIVDLDVHHGNGTAHVFAEDEGVFTFSMHGARNYPFEKPPSDRDVGLPDGTADGTYLERLRTELPDVMEVARPDLIFYLAGIDVAEGDRFGRLALTRSGIARRDRIVLEHAREANVPLTLLMSGGYARSPAATADLHAIAHREAARVYGPGPSDTDTSSVRRPETTRGRSDQSRRSSTSA